MTRFRKLPVEIEALRFTGDNWNEMSVFFGGKSGGSMWQAIGRSLVIKTLEGNMVADEGDWIIKGVAGEFYPCKPNIFDATYEAV